MIDYRAVFERCGAPKLGVVHVGAFDGGEDHVYRSMGFENRLFIEAQPDTFARLAPAIEAMGGFAENFAVSDRNGHATFHVAENGQSSSLLPMKKHSEIYPHIAVTRAIEVETVRLDDLLSRPKYADRAFNFLNMDIQGAELLALGGAVGALKQFDVLNLEVNFDELYENAPHIRQLDAFLGVFDFVRCDTFMWHASWGDAIYVRNGLTRAGA